VRVEARGRGLVVALLGALLAVGGGLVALLATRSDPPPAPAAAPLPADLVGTLVAAAAKDPKQVAFVAGMIRKQVEALARDGDWDGARSLARRAADAVPDLPGPRDFLIDLSRQELEDAVARGAVESLTREDPPAWYEANVAAGAERWKDVPHYQWLRATWFLAAEPARAGTADLVEQAVAANDDARRSPGLRALLASAVAATVGDAPLHGRYQDVLARLEKTAVSAPPPRPAVRRPGPGMRDR